LYTYKRAAPTRGGGEGNEGWWGLRVHTSFQCRGRGWGRATQHNSAATQGHNIRARAQRVCWEFVAHTAYHHSRTSPPPPAEHAHASLTSPLTVWSARHSQVLSTMTLPEPMLNMTSACTGNASGPPTRANTSEMTPDAEAEGGKAGRTVHAHYTGGMFAAKRQVPGEGLCARGGGGRGR
jgi:hypothetical protein